MIKVKLTTNDNVEALLRQTPNNDGVWGEYKFFINDDIEECDFWIVYSKGAKEKSTAKVARKNLILITGEPESIYHYSPSFVKNFGRVLTTRKDIKHNNITHTHPAQPWWLGRKYTLHGQIDKQSDYTSLSKEIIHKSKTISVITSAKAFTRGHQKRIDFVNKLKNHFGDQLDVFGRGINDFEDKSDVLKDYKYHIVIENSQHDHYWTEKLADNFLAECFPFYYGCNNIEEYFQDDSYIPINIDEIDKSIKVIENAIRNDYYEKYFKQIKKSKNKILNEYNIFPMLINFVKSHDISLKKEIITIHNEKKYFDIRKIPMIFNRFYLKLFKPFN